jgi:HAD superfamily hydrolase (TIGR01509 family)
VTILFDFGGTLDADGIRWSLRFHAAYRQVGGSLPFQAFEPLFCESDRQLAAVRDVRELGLAATFARQAELLAALLSARGESVDPSSLARPVHQASVAMLERNRPMLEGLAATHPLGIVSNFTGNLTVCLAETGLRPLFDAVVDSGVVGVGKPDPRIFEMALAALGADPASTWMVGDHPRSDILAAAALGMRTCWLAQPGEASCLPPGIPTARIARLTTLTGVLGLPCTV